MISRKKISFFIAFGFAILSSVGSQQMKTNNVILPNCHANVVQAAEITEKSGMWGKAKWSLSANGQLTISGDIGQSDSLKKILINSGVDINNVDSILIEKGTVANNISSMFAELPELKKIEGLSNLKYSGYAGSMFQSDSALENINLSGFDTSNIVNMDFMFYDIGAKSLDLSSFDTSNVDSMYGTFDGASKLEDLNISNFNTKKVTNMKFMFYGIAVKHLDLSSFDTSNVNSMCGMFDADRNLESLDLTGFNTSKVKNMSYMFWGNQSLKELNLSLFDTGKVTSMSDMFNDCSNLESLNIGNFNTQSVADMTNMFRSTSNLSSVDISSFSLSKDTKTSNMFLFDNKIKNINLGNKVYLKSDMSIPDIKAADGYTGQWQNVGKGTEEEPQGSNTWTSSELMSKYDPSQDSGIYVWKKDSRIFENNLSLGNRSDYSKDIKLKQYIPSATEPLHAYRYNVILNNDYPFYTKLNDNQNGRDNVASISNKVGATVYNRGEVQVTYTSNDGQKRSTRFEEISFDGNTWYWIDEHALNLDLSSKYPSLNNSGIPFYDGKFFGSTTIFGSIDENNNSNSQMITNAFNDEGQIIYKSEATVDNFSSFKDPSAALRAFNENLDRAASSWNSALNSNEPIFINANSTSKKPTLLISANKANEGSATLGGNMGIDSSLTSYALNKSDVNYGINILFITMRHEFGHSLGLNHTSGGQYYGMPDNYRFSDDDDVMNAILVKTPEGYPWGQKKIRENDINTVKLIIKNHNFMNPQH